jgi:serine/threonine-protein kinase PpkA
MPTVLIVDDEESIRKNIERLLTLEGFEVATAPNGQHGLVLAKSMLPDVLVTDVNMPVMDGFALVESVRALPQLVGTAIIMLTAVEDRANMRRGMSSGADDYITKPFRREELLDSIAAQLKKKKALAQQTERMVKEAVAVSEERIKAMFQSRYGGTGAESGFSNSSSFGLPPGTEPSSESESIPEATVLFADIRGFTTIAERLSGDELAGLLSVYFEQACAPILAQGGRHMKLMGDGLMAVFEDAHGGEVPHAQRALMAGIALRSVAERFREWMAERFANRGLRPFAIGVGIHTGPVTLSQLRHGNSVEVTPVGDTVNIAARLEAQSKELHWTIVASSESVALAGADVDIGKRQLVTIRGRAASVQACEVRGVGSVDLLLASEAQDSLDEKESSLGARASAVKEQAEQNSQLTARAAKEAIKQSLWSLQSGSFQSGMPQRFKGYYVERKLGEGGMSDVYLAYSEAQKSRVVLKVLKTAQTEDSEMLRRFIQEYAVLGSIEHKHIARIFDQGFTDEYAYIAMEYLAGGEFKALISQRISHDKVVIYLRQIVSALAEIHRLGLVYRDLKPDNLMFRAEDELVLVDFGIVKSTRTGGASLVRTQHGQIVGTPYYISPEQASDREVTHRSDFYSLGVVLYEMLTGDKPYRAQSLDLLLARHLYGATPDLPAEHAIFQPLLTKLMAKSPNDRPESCIEIWETIKGL